MTNFPKPPTHPSYFSSNFGACHRRHTAKHISGNMGGHYIRIYAGFLMHYLAKAEFH